MALGELGCHSLDYVYRMTWAEFRLRLIAFNRLEIRNEYKMRRLGWISYIAPHQNPKRLRGLKESKWWPIGEKEVIKVDDAHKKRYIEEYVKYLQKKKDHGRT